VACTGLASFAVPATADLDGEPLRRARRRSSPRSAPARGLVARARRPLRPSGARRGAADRLCAAPCGQASTFTLPSGRATHIKIHPSALSPDPNPSSISILTSPSSSLVTQVPQRP